jgi:hypothetical protein
MLSQKITVKSIKKQAGNRFHLTRERNISQEMKTNNGKTEKISQEMKTVSWEIFFISCMFSEKIHAGTSSANVLID